MRHRWGGRKLGRTSTHRLSLLRNMVTEFLDKERLITTVPKAKTLKPYAEKMITLGKRDNLHARRQALSVIKRKGVVHKLFDSLAPRYADRKGGYTRIIRLGLRKGDAAELAIIELVESEGSAEGKSSQEKAAKSKKTKGEEGKTADTEQAKVVGKGK